MDYTSVTRVRAALRTTATNTAMDSLIASLITSVSRWLDAVLAQVPTAPDYLKLETVTDEQLEGDADIEGTLVLFPHKVTVVSASGIQYRKNPREAWTVGDASLLEVSGGNVVKYWGELPRFHYQAKLTYVGGLAATTESLPADVLQCATVLVVRALSDVEAGESDVVGTQDGGQLLYTKTIPEKVRANLEPYFRRVRW